MTTPPNEYGDETADQDLNDEAPVVETAGDYGQADPPPVPVPPDDEDQNPGRSEEQS
jgi:hypothetical protein